MNNINQEWENKNWICQGLRCCPLGMSDATKTDEFSETFQTALESPASFLENHIAIFFRKALNKALDIGPKSAKQFL